MSRKISWHPEKRNENLPRLFPSPFASRGFRPLHGPVFSCSVGGRGKRGGRLHPGPGQGHHQLEHRPGHGPGIGPPEKQQDGTLTPLPGSARAQATSRLIQTLKQIAITQDLSVEQYAATHDKILAGIEKTAQDAETVRQVYTSALDVDIRVETSIFGGFLQLVLPEDIRQIPKIADQKPKKGKFLPPSVPVQAPHTGLIIDARELELHPILYPVIVSEEGKEIYSSLFISREFAVQYGVCTYICDMDRALAFRRIGSNPLVFKALRKEGSTSGNIVISMADAKTIEKVTERHRFLKECRVIIVTGP